jgi:hypothetical protein
MSDEKNNQPIDHSAGYEKGEIDLKKTVIITIVTVLFIAVSLVFLNEYFMAAKEEIIQEQVLEPPSMTLEELAAYEDSVLAAYGKNDSLDGVYQIPIEKAMELVAEDAVADK